MVQLGNATTLAGNSVEDIKDVAPRLDVCDAPPPDSFHVKNIGANFLVLGWQPVWPGATHTLTVLASMDSIVWTPVDTFHNIPGSSFTVSNLQPGLSYRITLATNCVTGEPGVRTVSFDPPYGLILELVLNGRTPLNPVIVPPCQTISYHAHNWVGFKVQRGFAGDDLNYFEFGEGSYMGLPAGLIKRTFYGPNIVATDLGGTFPKLPFPTEVIVGGEGVISIRKVKNGIGQIIGYVDVYVDELTGVVSFCKNSAQIWDQNFSFNVITAESTAIMNQSMEVRSFFGTVEPNFKITTPFNDHIDILLPCQTEPYNKMNINLFDLKGQLILEFSEIPSFESISIPVHKIPQGLYVLLIKTAENVKVYKIQKI